MEIIKLKRFPSYVTRGFFHFSNLKLPSYEKLAMMSQFDLTRLYDDIICNSVFQLGFLTRQFHPFKHSPIVNEFFICNYLNVNTDKDKDFLEYHIRHLEDGKSKNKRKNRVNSYFKIYSTDSAISND